jgi:C1A family cysteine protease
MMQRKKGGLALMLFSAVFFLTGLSRADELGEFQKGITNKGAKWVAGNTSMMQLHPTERIKRLGLNYSKEMAAVQATPYQESFTAVPGTFDWRNIDGNGKSYVTPVKNQQSCGSCWAFATAAALESYLLMTQNVPNYNLDLSEQLLLSCYNTNGCSGGSPSGASYYIQSVGLPVESCFTYKAFDAQDGANSVLCGQACSNWANTTYRISHYGSVSATVSAIKDALVNYGPLVTTFSVYADFFSYHGGIYSYTSGTYQGGHAVLIVGYDDANQCFIVKNSWGTGWGEAGYFRIAYSQLASPVYFGYGTLTYYGSLSTPTITVTKPASGEAWQTATTQTISWSYTGNPGSYVKIDLWKGGTFSQTLSSSTSIAGSYSWSVPTSLSAGSDYKIVVTSTSNASVSGNSPAFSITASVNAPTATTVAAGSVTGTGAVLNGTVNANNFSTTVTFQYGLTASYGSTVTADQSPVTGTGNTTVSKTISGLTPGTTYHYRVVAVNSAGTTIGADMTFTTSDTASPSLAITSHTNSQHVTTSSITISGTASDSGKGNNGISQVTVNGVRASNDTATGSGTASWSKQVALSNGVNSLTVIAYDSINNPTTQTIAIYYDIAATGSASRVTRTSAILNGTVSPNGSATTYHFEWGLTAAYGNSTSTQSAGSGSGNVAVSANLTGLTPLATYHYRLVATNSGGTTQGVDKTFVARNGKTDFNGDGKPDIFWRNNLTGDVAVWYMNGANVQSGDVIYAGIPLNWQIAGTDDFNGDGKPDILWRDKSTGDVAVWLMNGSTLINGAIIYQGIPLNWEIAGTGDFNGNGKADILWRDKSTGDVAVWFLNGTVLINGTIIYQGIPLNWEIAGTGDFDGDGKTDILWRNKTSGDVAVWHMEGSNLQYGELISSGVALNWQIVGNGDFNGLGQSDILWKDKISGDLALWYMNGSSLISGAMVYQGMPSLWDPMAR